MKTIIIDGIEYNLTPKVLFKKGDSVVIQETTYLISKIEGLNVTLSYNGRECLFDIDVLKNARLQDITKDATMSLDEAIEHCKEKSCGNNACALEHKQLEKWLTELKELKEQKPAWSEEDNAMLISIENILSGRGHSFHDKEINWLKSLIPQTRWKPSDEQIKALDFAADCICFKSKGEVLKELLEQLKKLRKISYE